MRQGRRRHKGVFFALLSFWWIGIFPFPRAAALEMPFFSVDGTGDLIKALVSKKKDAKGEVSSQVLFSAEEEKRASIHSTRSQASPVSPTPIETTKPVLSSARPELSPRVQEVDAPEETPAPVPSRAEGPEIRTVEEEFQPPAEAARYIGQPISLDFRDTDIRDILRVLADISGMNIIATDDVSGRITLRLINIPWDQALDVVLQANGLERVQMESVVQVSTAERLSRERTARLQAQQAEENLEPIETEYMRINYANAENLTTLIQGTEGEGTGILTNRGSIFADAGTNTLIVRDTQVGIDTVREFVQQLDIQTPQVLIEAYLVEASEDIGRDLGIQWGYQHIASPETGNPTGKDFPGRIGFGGGLESGGVVPEGPPGSGGITAIPFIADFPATVAPGAGSALNLALGSLSGQDALSLRLTALEAQGRVRITSHPRVMTLNNREARIESVRIVRVPTPSTTSIVAAPGAIGAAEAAFQEFSTGIILSVTPQVSADGFVFLAIETESSQLAVSSIDSSITNIPDELSRTANSSVLIKSGETFVLGGIVRDEFSTLETGVPYLRDVPVLGWLFKGRSVDEGKEELLVFITPTIAASPQLAGLPTAQQLWENRPRTMSEQP